MEFFVFSILLEKKFISVPPSCIAGAVLTASVIGLNHCSLESMRPFLDELSEKLESTSDVLTPIYYSIEDCVKKAYHPTQNGNHDDDALLGQSFEQCKLQEMMDHDEQMTTINGKETPVDVQNVEF